MRPRPLVRLATAALSCAMCAAPVQPALAQERTAETPEEIVVVGTRRQNRTVTETPVPIDIFNEVALATISSPEMVDVLQKLVPALNVGRWPLGDGALRRRDEQQRIHVRRADWSDL